MYTERKKWKPRDKSSLSPLVSEKIFFPSNSFLENFAPIHRRERQTFHVALRKRFTPF